MKTEGIAYGDGPRQRLDLYVPEEPAGGGPVVVFFYGGNWQSGTRDDYKFAGEAFAARGYTVAIPDYRLYPEVRFPSFLDDAAAAVAWVQRHTAGNAARPLYLVGHSAGAYIALMLTLDERWLADAGLKVCSTVAAAVGLAGPYDFLPLTSPALKEIFGPPETRGRTQPINHADGSAPPILLITGLDDETVLPRNTSSLAARVRQQGGAVEERYYADVGHTRLVASLAAPLRGLTPALDDIDRFLARTAAAGCAA